MPMGKNERKRENVTHKTRRETNRRNEEEWKKINSATRTRICGHVSHKIARIYETYTHRA